MKKFAILLPLLSFHMAHASDTFGEISFGGFLDTYLAYDFNQPQNQRRTFTTQPARHLEPNINLAYVEAKLQKEKIRSRLALQFGNSVDENTVSEPNQDLKHFQEAFVGAKITSNTWVDMGIFLGHVGAESWISKDNWTYSRALMLDYVPYYSAGLRLQHKISAQDSIQFQLLNGWSNMGENNQSKAVGMQYHKTLGEELQFTYNNFFGDEEVTGPQARFRGYHDFILKWLYSDRWQFMAAFDIGHQAQQKNDGINAWWASAITVRRILTPRQRLAFRAEYYHDPHEANVLTSTAHGFQVVGASLNFDQDLDQRVMWRTELRGLHSKDRVFPRRVHKRSYMDSVLVTSLSVWF